MKQTNAPKLTPSPSSKEKSRAVADKDGATKVFISMVLDMTWRLAIVVLIPVILGAELDRRYKTHHIYLIVGFIIAILAGTLVVYRSYQLANSITGAKGGGNAK